VRGIDAYGVLIGKGYIAPAPETMVGVLGLCVKSNERERDAPASICYGAHQALCYCSAMPRLVSSAVLLR